MLTVTGIVGAEGGAVDLTHGRVVAIGPSTIRYESFPMASGTEVINYEVVDRFGGVSRAFVRVGVVAPGDPQPPVAIDDTVTAAPGKTVTPAKAGVSRLAGAPIQTGSSQRSLG